MKTSNITTSPLQNITTTGMTRLAIFCIAAFLCLFMFDHQSAAASTSDGGLAIDSTLTNIEGFFTGTLAKAISLAAIIGCGSVMILRHGQISEGMQALLWTIVVIAIIAQAPAVYTWASGGGADIRGHASILEQAAKSPYLSAGLLHPLSAVGI